MGESSGGMGLHRDSRGTDGTGETHRQPQEGRCGCWRQGETGVSRCQGPMGVGPSHSSEEACEGDNSNGWSEGEG